MRLSGTVTPEARLTAWPVRDGELRPSLRRWVEHPSGLQVLLIEGEPGIGKSTVWLAGIEREAHSRAGISFERISVAIPIDDIEAA